MDDYFVFNGQSTEAFGMAVESFPAQNGPKRKRTEFSVPGRNGTLHADEAVWENIKQEYAVWFRGGLPTPEQSHGVKAWLLAPGGYCRLEDKYDPLHFRLASFAGPLNIANILNRYGKCKIAFDCDPRAFLKCGENPLVFTGQSVLYNFTEFPAQPLVKVLGNGAGTVAIGGVTVQILDMTTGMMLDCENENAYAMGDVADSRNHLIYAPKFPVLEPGENGILFTGGVTSVEIIPRWWEL